MPPPVRANWRLNVRRLTRSNTERVDGERELGDADWSSPEWRVRSRFELWIHEIELEIRVLETCFTVR